MAIIMKIMDNLTIIHSQLIGYDGERESKAPYNTLSNRQMYGIVGGSFLFDRSRSLHAQKVYRPIGIGYYPHGYRQHKWGILDDAYFSGVLCFDVLDRNFHHGQYAL